MIGRRQLIGGLVAGALVRPGVAAATGGLDAELGTPPPSSGSHVPAARNPAVRVLLATRVGSEAVSASGAGAFSFAGKTYRGVPAIVDAPNLPSALVATVPLDAYLYAVVPLEIGRGGTDAALQAQAIVARTYALAHRAQGRPYDLVAHAGDQVWGAIDAESPQTSRAVDATSGAVVTYGGGLATVFYASCCGGHTADARGLWGGADLPYLRGVDDPYCLISPDARWSETLSVGDLSAALGSRLAGLGTLRRIGLGDPAADMRRTVTFAGTAGVLDLSSAQVRSALGSRVPLRSSFWLSLTVAGDPAQPSTQVTIEGAGRGHGVGLCQWGARVMARAGRSAREIVAYYFPGTTIDVGGS